MRGCNSQGGPYFACGRNQEEFPRWLVRSGFHPRRRRSTERGEGTSIFSGSSGWSVNRVLRDDGHAVPTWLSRKHMARVFEAVFAHESGPQYLGPPRSKNVPRCAFCLTAGSPIGLIILN